MKNIIFTSKLEWQPLNLKLRSMLVHYNQVACQRLLFKSAIWAMFYRVLLVALLVVIFSISCVYLPRCIIVVFSSNLTMWCLLHRMLLFMVLPCYTVCSFLAVYDWYYTVCSFLTVYDWYYTVCSFLTVFDWYYTVCSFLTVYDWYYTVCSFLTVYDWYYTVCSFLTVYVWYRQWFVNLSDYFGVTIWTQVTMWRDLELVLLNVTFLCRDFWLNKFLEGRFCNVLHDIVWKTKCICDRF